MHLLSQCDQTQTMASEWIAVSLSHHVCSEIDRTVNIRVHFKTKPTPIFPNKLKTTKTIIAGAIFHIPDTPSTSPHALFPLRLIPGKTYNKKSQTTSQIPILPKHRGKPQVEIEN